MLMKEKKWDPLKTFEATKSHENPGASSTAATLKLVCGEEGRSQGDIATAAMASINQFLSKQVK